MTAPMDFTVLTASTVASRWVIRSVTPPPTQCGPSASWPVVLVPIGGPWMIGAGVDAERRRPSTVIGKRSRPRGAGPALLLADAVVLRAVALALEPLRGHALRHAAAEVHALLVERGEPGLHARRARARE